MNAPTTKPAGLARPAMAEAPKLETYYPPATLLLGPTGTGKTYSLASILKAGKRLCLLATERHSVSRVVQAARAIGAPLDKFHYAHALPVASSIEMLDAVAVKLQVKDFEALAKETNMNKNNAAWRHMLELIQNFKDERTKQELGCPADWDDDTFFVIDSCTGLNTMCASMVVGAKPNPAPGEWNIMQTALLHLIQYLVYNLPCYFVLIAHVEKELNEITGAQVITVSTIGRKLAPKLAPEFTNVVVAKKNQSVFQWSTMEMNTDLKSGDLPLSNQLPPDFAQVINAYEDTLKP